MPNIGMYAAPANRDDEPRRKMRSNGPVGDNRVYILDCQNAE